MPLNRLKTSKPLVHYADLGGFFARYFWIIVKNVLGWLLILSAIPIGGLIPGPLGTPLFLVGFALITFPGKRRLTSRLLRGIPYNLWTPRERLIRAGISLVLPPLILWLFARREFSLIHPQRIGVFGTISLYLIGIATMWTIILWLGRLMNVAIRLLPRIRRSIRPWLKRHGINLLPPRKRNRNLRPAQGGGEDEILEIHRPNVGQMGRDFQKSVSLMRFPRWMTGHGKNANNRNNGSKRSGLPREATMSRTYLVLGEFLFVAVLCVAAIFMFRQHPPVPDAVKAEIKLPDPQAQVYIVRETTGQFTYLVSHPNGNTQRLSPDDLTNQLYQTGKTGGFSAALGLSSSAVVFWIGIGLLGQILFTGRMIVQWLASEKKGESVVPPLFWWMSLAGSLLLLAYFLWRRDPIGLLGQAFGSFIYLRNILWILKSGRAPGMAASEAIAEQQ